MSFFGSIAPIAGMVAGNALAPGVGGVIGGALGGAIGGNEKAQRQKQIEDQSRKLASETARYSPWTHMTPGPIQYAGSDMDNIGGSALGGGLTGLSLGQALGGAAPASSAVSNPPGGQYSLGVNTNLGQSMPSSPPSFGLNTWGQMKEQQSPNMFANNKAYNLPPINNFLSGR